MNPGKRLLVLTAALTVAVLLTACFDDFDSLASPPAPTVSPKEPKAENQRDAQRAIGRDINSGKSPDEAYRRAVENFGEQNAAAGFAAHQKSVTSMQTATVELEMRATQQAREPVQLSPAQRKEIELQEKISAGNREAIFGTRFSQAEPPPGEPIEVWRVDNLLRVFNGGTPTSFTIAKDHWVTEVGTYHYNDGKGKAAGTIVLKASDGTTYGPWQAELDQGWYWRAKPNMWLPAGSYTVIDSDPSTWSQNPTTGGQGIAWMFGKPAP